MFGRQAIVDRHDDDIGAHRHFGAHVVMGFATSQNPAAAMKIDDARLRRFAGRAVDANMDALDVEILDHEALGPRRPEHAADVLPALALLGQGPVHRLGR